LAPLEPKCNDAPFSSVNTPVDSQMYIAPTEAQSISPGFFSLNARIFFPSTIKFCESYETFPGKRP